MKTIPTGKSDTCSRVTAEIISAIEAGAPTYKMPWNASGGFIASPINATTRRPYRGINVLILWMTAHAKGHKSGTWATYKQWQELGGQVRKGERSANVVLWKFFDPKSQGVQADEGDRAQAIIPMVRDYYVFNSAQVDGYNPHCEQKLNRSERIAQADSYFAALGVKIHAEGNRASYNSRTDTVHMPAFEAFKEALFYYSVLAHETTHWTGSEKRLKRDLKNRFGNEAYAMEELIAELGAAFLCAELGLPSDPRKDHAPYIASWLKVLRNDKRAIFTAATKAQAAVDWMNRLAGRHVEEETD